MSRILFKAFMVVALSLLLTPALSASPLQELIESRGMAKLDRKNKILSNRLEVNNRREASPWMNKNTNFGKIYTKGIHPSKVMNWVFSSSTTHRLRDVKHKFEREFCKITGRLNRGKKVDMEFALLIPHPKHREAVEYGLVSAFKELAPERSQLEFAQELTIGKSKSEATLYQIRGGSCSIVIDIDQASKLQIFYKKCKRINNLTTLADEIDIRRLNRKLNT